MAEVGAAKEEGLAIPQSGGILETKGEPISALEHNIKSKGDTSYYFAHASNLASSGGPRLVAYDGPVSWRGDTCPFHAKQEGSMAEKGQMGAYLVHT